MRIREGVSPQVNARMEAVNANVLENNGLMLRTCEHGVRHPVGHLHRPINAADFSSHEMKTVSPLPRRVPCCDAKCCLQWPTTPKEVVEAGVVA